MKIKIGTNLTTAVKKRINQLEAASNFQIFLSTGLGSTEPLKGKFIGCYSVHLTANYRLIFRILISDIEESCIALCKDIIIKGVVDYHGQKNNWIIS